MGKGRNGLQGEREGQLEGVAQRGVRSYELSELGMVQRQDLGEFRPIPLALGIDDVIMFRVRQKWKARVTQQKASGGQGQCAEHSLGKE